MKNWMLLVVLSLLLCGMSWAQGTEKLIYNGVPWFDDRGEIVNAHGACIVEENGRYYLFGDGNRMKVMLSPVLAVILPMIW